MTDDADDGFDPAAREEREIGREMVDESTGLGSVMAHAYRGEMTRVTTWRGRLDQTTTWAVTVIAALLTWAFSAADNPHYILLVGMVVVAVFVGVEARRYRDYDVYRSRVRLIQQNLLANALDPSRGVELRDWRRELGEDYRRPTLKVSLGEALANRLRRVYLPLFGILLVAWVGESPPSLRGETGSRRPGSGRFPVPRWSSPSPSSTPGSPPSRSGRESAGRKASSGRPTPARGRTATTASDPPGPSPGSPVPTALSPLTADRTACPRPTRTC